MRLSHSPQDRLSALRRIIGAGAIQSLALVASAWPAVGQITRPPVLLTFALQDSAGSISGAEPRLRISHSTSGMKASEFRVSSRADFVGAAWQPYKLDIRLVDWRAYVLTGPRCSNGGTGVRLVMFMQVRADLGGAVQIVNGHRTVVAQKIESNVLSDDICVLD